MEMDCQLVLSLPAVLLTVRHMEQFGSVILFLAVLSEVLAF